MKVGIISTVHINDATPSVFYSGQPKRKMAKDIARELLDSGFDLFAGGGLQKVSDQKTFLEAGGYSFIDNRKDFQRLKAGSKHYIACPIRDESQACRYSIDKGSKEIRLSEFTKKAIDLLKGPEGFFLMVEGGKIDWACHANDARTAIDELLAFDAAVREAIKFYKQHPEDTAIIVVADHETGGLGLGISETYYKSHLERLMHQKMSIQELDIKVAEYRSKTPAGKARLEDLLPIIKKGFGLGDASKGLALSEQDIHELRLAFNASMSGLKDDTIYAKYSEALSSKVATILSKKAGLGWTTFYHTASPVVAFAQGTGSTLFSGFIDNTDVAKNIITIMGFDR